MASELSSVLNLANLSAISKMDIEGDDVNPRATPGAISFKISQGYGMQMFKYARNRNGSDVVRGELMSYLSEAVGDRNTSVTNITSGSTTSAVTTGLTANDHDGMLCVVLDNNDVAGGVPEGEIAVVANNSATLITLEADYPLSTALAANDDLELVATFQFNDSADTDEAWVVMGVVAPAGGIANGNYGWLHIEGMGPVLYTTAATGEGEAIIADVAAVKDGGGGAEPLVVGISPAGIAADQRDTELRALALMKLFTVNNSGSA